MLCVLSNDLLVFNSSRGTPCSLSEHHKAVHKEVKYGCSTCEYQTTTRKRLFEHTRAVHKGIKYPCSKCKYQAITRSYLAEHQRAVHEGVKSSSHKEQSR